MSLAATLLASLTIAAAPVEAPKPDSTVVLRYRFAEGEALRYRIEHAATQLAVKGEYRQKNASRTRTDQQMEVVGIDPGGTATLRLTIDQAWMQYAFNDEQPNVFDSRENTLPAGVAKAVGRPIAEVRVEADGTVDSIRPLLPADELDAIPGKLGLEGEDPSSLFAVFPQRPLDVGDEWSESFPVRVTVTGRLTQEVKILRQYQLDAVKDGIAQITVKTSLLTPITEPSLLVQLIQRTSTGYIRFDVAAGRIVERTTSLDNMEIGWGGGDSSMRAVGTWSERLVTEPATVSAR